jgi:hypothetical protein
MEQRSAKFEMPSLLNIGVTYHYRMTEAHRLSFAGTFTSNSFSKDQIRGGLEYGFKQYLALRGGYVYEKGIGSSDASTTAFTGPTAGRNTGNAFRKREERFLCIGLFMDCIKPISGKSQHWCSHSTLNNSSIFAQRIPFSGILCFFR